MYNDLVERGINDPIVGGILVSGTDMRTFVLQLEFSKTYELVQLSKAEIFSNTSSMTLLPTLVNNLLWLKVRWLGKKYYFIVINEVVY